MGRVLARLRAFGYVTLVDGFAQLTERGQTQVQAFRSAMFEASNMPDIN